MTEYGITIKQAARRLGCSKDRVRKLIKKGILRGHTELDPKAGSNLRWIIDRQSMAAAEAAREKS